MGSLSLATDSRSDLDEDQFSALEQDLRLIEAGAPERLPTTTLRDGVLRLARLQRALEAVGARWLAELDRRVQQQAPPDSLRSTSLWLEDALHLTSSAAYAQLCTARQLEHLPLTADALRQGELGGQHVSVICQAVRQAEKTSLDPSAVEAELVHAAERMDPQALLQHWYQVRYQADQEAGVEAEEEQRQRRWLHLRRTWAGGFRLEGELDAEGGATLKTALQGLMGRRAAGDERPPERRRADALVELARRRLDAGDLPERGGEKPHLAVVAELATLRLEPGSRLAELDWGPLVTGETARRIGCDASTTPVLVGADGEILHVGRRSRSVPAPVRRALNLRDRHCQGPGCRVPPELCAPHHLRHWVDGGPDELSNLRLFCDHHHSLRHPENARFRRREDHGGPATLRDP